jgi:hypothetical protein
MICRESRFEWGLGNTRQYLGLFIDRVYECLDFSTFVISSKLRDLTLSQVVPMDFFCTNVRWTTLDGQLRQLMPHRRVGQSVISMTASVDTLWFRTWWLAIAN